MNSRQKGKRGELEFAAYLKLAGYEARRGQQFSGGKDSPDVVTNIPGVHFEVKRVDSGASPYAWLEQAELDSGEKIPVVAHRRNRKNWIAIIRMDDLLDLLALRNEGRKAA